MVKNLDSKVWFLQITVVHTLLSLSGKGKKNNKTIEWTELNLDSQNMIEPPFHS